MNKFELINKALTADLKPILGKMLVEFIMRADENGFSHVGAERLCKVRGIKHTKNFPWHELHALSDVLTIKQGKTLTAEEVEQIEATGKTVYGDKNYFWIKETAILSLGDFNVTKSVKPKAAERIKAAATSTPVSASTGSKTPATADPSTLQVQTKTPASAGCNSTNTTLQEESTSESTTTAGAVVIDTPSNKTGKETASTSPNSKSEDTSLTSKDEALPLNSKGQGALNQKIMEQARADVKAKKAARMDFFYSTTRRIKTDPAVAAAAEPIYADPAFMPGKGNMDRLLEAVRLVKQDNNEKVEVFA